MERKAIAGNTSTGVLKIIALVFMFCDHAGKMLLPNVLEMRMLGRIAFPLYCWCMVVGANYTRSMPKYLLRIALIGLVSQPLYMWGLNHTWDEPNIFLTLAVSLCGLWGLKEKKWGSHIWGPILALLAAVILKCDYGWRGVLLVLLLWAVRDSRPGIAAVMTAFCLYWGSTSMTVTEFFGLPLRGIPYPLNAFTAPLFKLQTLAIFSLPLMLIRFPWKLKLPNWVSYAMYPGHLVLLIILEQIV